MARAKNKKELLVSSQENYNKLLTEVQSLPDDLQEIGGVCEEWSVKDMLAHLHAWHLLFLTWYREGMAGEKPPMPAPGYNWKETPELNLAIYDKYKAVPFQEILKEFQESHLDVQQIIQKHNQEELFTKKLYKWTGTTSLGSYLVSTCPSHYKWALDHLSKWIKNNPDFHLG